MRTTPLQPWISATIGALGPGLDPDELQRYQLARLQDTVGLVRTRSPFYRRSLAGAPLMPATLAALATYPFTTAADLTREGLRLVCVGQDDIERVVTLDTSGTTGAPKRLYFTRADQQLTVDFFRVGMSTFTGP
jgi:phenylacetate-CoA ligase